MKKTQLSLKLKVTKLIIKRDNVPIENIILKILDSHSQVTYYSL